MQNICEITFDKKKCKKVQFDETTSGVVKFFSKNVGNGKLCNTIHIYDCTIFPHVEHWVSQEKLALKFIVSREIWIMVSCFLLEKKKLKVGI